MEGQHYYSQGPLWAVEMGCGNGLTGTSRTTAKGNTQTCIWDEITLCTGIGWVILDRH